MGTRVKLVAFSLGALATALLLLLLLTVPDSKPPGMVERIDLRAPHGSQHHLPGSARAATAGPPRQRYGRGDRRPGATARRGQEPAGAPTPTLVSTGQGGAGAQRTPADQNGAADPPTWAPRGESAPRAGAPRTPRQIPAPGTPAAPREARPVGAPPSEPPDPADAPDPPEPPELPDETASPAAADPPESPEPPDGDSADEP